MTLIHEFGHHFGAVDYYSTTTSNASVFPTADMNAKYKDEKVTFSDYCIYGANFTSAGVISALPICQGCRYLISEGIKNIQ